MSYTYLSATYANAEKTAVVAMTEEAGAIALSIVDTPDAWAGLVASGVVFEAYVEPTAPAGPAPVEKLAAFLSENPDVLELITPA